MRGTNAAPRCDAPDNPKPCQMCLLLKRYPKAKHIVHDPTSPRNLKDKETDGGRIWELNVYLREEEKRIARLRTPLVRDGAPSLPSPKAWPPMKAVSNKMYWRPVTEQSDPLDELDQRSYSVRYLKAMVRKKISSLCPTTSTKSSLASFSHSFPPLVSHFVAGTLTCCSRPRLSKMPPISGCPRAFDWWRSGRQHQRPMPRRRPRTVYWKTRIHRLRVAVVAAAAEEVVVGNGRENKIRCQHRWCCIARILVLPVNCTRKAWHLSLIKHSKERDSHIG